MPSFSNPTLNTIAEFLDSIGIPVAQATIEEETFLPGVTIYGGRLLVDEARLLWPGDLLHEAGHLAVVTPERRALLGAHAGDDPGEEMMAIAWSWAAAKQLGIEPEVVFHEGGYHGGSSSIIENFSEGRYFGVPTLQWIGLTYEPRQAEENNVEPYPHMIRWLRER